VNGTLFYIFGITLVVSAVVVALVGLRFEDFPPTRIMLAAVVAYFACLVGATTTFAVLHAADDQHARQAEQAQAATQTPTGSTSTGSTTASVPGISTSSTTTPPTAGGEGSTLKLAAAPDTIAYDTKQLSGKAGQVTIDFDNPSALTHDVCIEGPTGQQVGCSDQIAQSTTTLSENLKGGKYTFFCSVDSHRQAGMEGTLTIK
jgi:plastocyanin